MIGAEYFDRLSLAKINKLRDILGGELGWKQKVRENEISKEEFLRIGKIVFEKECKRVWLEFEVSGAGWEIPIIKAEY